MSATDSRVAEPCVLVIFGAAGNLSMKKLLPAVYTLARLGLLPEGFALVGFDNKAPDEATFKEWMREAVNSSAGTHFCEETWQHLRSRIRYVSGEFTMKEDFASLAQTLRELDEKFSTEGNRVYYLATPPKFFGTVTRALHGARLLNDRNRKGMWHRVVVEKPFGANRKEARRLNSTLQRYIPNNSIYRIDHYLGKEMVRNIVPLRFDSGLLKMIWDNKHIDHVQITMAEEVGVDGRGKFYDGVGAARDVMQNHLLQILALVAMEEPAGALPQQLSEAKAEVLRAVKVPRNMARSSARGQYTAGTVDGKPTPSFRDEDDIYRHSRTESYAALRLDIDTDRWRGVPFYLRTGKRLSMSVVEIAIVFKKDPTPGAQDATATGSPTLVIRIQPRHGVRFIPEISEFANVLSQFDAGASVDTDSVAPNLDAYERLILDVLLGDPTRFPQIEEIEQSWRIIDPLVRFWKRQWKKPPPYPPGSWGPASADEMLANHGHQWRTELL